MEQKTKGAANLFHHTVINGDSTLNEDEFDGLDIMLTGSSTEYNAGDIIDISTADDLKSNHQYFIDMLDEFISGLEGVPDIIMGNTKLLTKIRSAARRAGYLTQSEDAFGRKVEKYGDTILMDMKNYWNGSATTPVVGIDADGTTSLYAAGLGLDAFHGVSPAGDKIIHTYLPDMNAPKAVKDVEVEMVAAVVLKNTLKAGVFRGIKVQ